MNDFCLIAADSPPPPPPICNADRRGARKYSFTAFFTEETDAGDAEGDRLRRQEKKEKGGNLW